MEVDALSILSHGFGVTPQPESPVHDIILEDDVFTLEDESSD